jgi:FKBP-type peptidyl-prolyl cis-trans isomerase
MNFGVRLLGGLLLGCLTGCGLSQPPAPVEVVKDELTQRREWLFGPRCLAKEIDWFPNGLGVRMIAAGTGTPPKSTDRVRVHYVCSLKDGRVVLDTRTAGKPADYVVNQLISGWAIGMGELKPGGRAELFIPPSLGYGNNGVGDIPSGSGLIFEVELLEVNPAAPLPKG